MVRSIVVGALAVLAAWAARLGTIREPTSVELELNFVECRQGDGANVRQFRRAWGSHGLASSVPALTQESIAGDYIEAELSNLSHRLSIRADGSYDVERCGCTGCSVTH